MKNLVSSVSKMAAFSRPKKRPFFGRFFGPKIRPLFLGPKIRPFLAILKKRSFLGPKIGLFFGGPEIRPF